jgi:hypothetical protein
MPTLALLPLNWSTDGWPEVELTPSDQTTASNVHAVAP